MTVYESFLRLLDFDEEELGKQLPYWRSACRKAGITEQDLRYAMTEWLPHYWDLNLRGIRKCIGAYFREFIETFRLAEYKSNGAKLLYYDMPSHPVCFYANKLSGGENLHISYPDYIVATVFNAFLNKKTASGSAEADRRSLLCHQCGMNRGKADMRYRSFIEDPAVLWSWGLYCDEGYKTEELIENLDGRRWPTVLTTIPKDASCGVPEAEDNWRTEYLAAQLREGQRQVSAYTGVPVPERALAEACEGYLAYVQKVERLTELVSGADPQPITGNELTLFYIPIQIALDTGLGYVDEAIDLMTAEVRDRISRGEGPLPKNAPRLACHFVPFSVPWINKAFIDNGVNLSINTFFATAERLTACFDQEDLYRSIARQWLSNPSAVNMRSEVELVCEILKKYPQDGVLYGFFAFDCWIGSLQKTMIRLVEERTHIPHFYLESEFWSSDQYSLEDRLTRIQNIAYKLKINHMLSGWSNAKKQDT